MKIKGLSKKGVLKAGREKWENCLKLNTTLVFKGKEMKRALSKFYIKKASPDGGEAYLLTN